MLRTCNIRDRRLLSEEDEGGSGRVPRVPIRIRGAEESRCMFAVIDLVIYRLQWSSSHLLVDQPGCRWISQSVNQSINQRATQSVNRPFLYTSH